MDPIATRAFLAITGAELAPKLVLMTSGDRVVARMTGALALGAVGAWFAWASRAGALALALVLSLAITATWLAITASMHHWLAPMLATRAAIAVMALWLAANVEQPKMPWVVAIGATMMIVEITIAVLPAPVANPEAMTLIAAKFGWFAPSVVPTILLALVIWAAWNDIVAVCRGRLNSR